MGRLSSLRKAARTMASSRSFFGNLMSPNGAYQGASSVRAALQSWFTSQGSADIDVLSNLSVLRSRSRDLIRNNPTAAAAVKRKTTHVVATGLRWKSQLDAEALGISEDEARAKEKELTGTVHTWAKSKDSDASRINNFYQNQSLVFRSRFESGDVFVMLPFIDRPNALLDVAIKLVESDLCRDPSVHMPTRKLAGGIEQDEWGAAIAYWFAKSHIQDINVTANLGEMVRVPAYGEETGRPMVLHVFQQDRPNQRRGVPELSPCIEPLKNRGRYSDSELMAAVIAGMYTVFIKTATGAPTGGGNVPTSAQVGGTVAKGEPGNYELSYGGVVDMNHDDEIQTANPGRPNSNFDPFMFSILKEIGGVIGMSAEMIQGYYASSYNAARAAFLDAYRGFKVDIANLETDLCEPVKNTVYLNAVLRNVVDLPGYLDDPRIRNLWEAGTWIAVAPGQLDPVKETKAYQMKLEDQLISRTRASQEVSNEDYERIVIDLAGEQTIRDENGVVPPGKAGIAAMTAAATAKEGAQTAEDEGEIEEKPDAATNGGSDDDVIEKNTEE